MPECSSYSTRFVIQRHTRPDDVHLDLMIEKDGALKTWRLNGTVDYIAGNSQNAQSIFDHELRFLTYNGPVNKGTGSVTIADSGVCQITEWNDEHIEGRFEGKIVNDHFVLRQIDDKEWNISCD